MPRHTRRAGKSPVTSSPSNRIRPESGTRNPLIMLKKVVLPAPFGPDGDRDGVDSGGAAEPARDIVDFEQAHRAVFRPMMPSTPLGKNNTTRTKNRPMNDIQLAVWLDT